MPGALLVNRYRIVSLLGKGGMGEVYRADDLTVGQPVAFKFLPAIIARDAEALERFHNEVRIARQVSHPNVCRVYDVGEADGMPYISMEYVDGEDLASLLRRIGRLPADKALEIAPQDLRRAGRGARQRRAPSRPEARQHHARPARQGAADGLRPGRLVADELRGAEARSGTPAYMAPEQLRGEKVTVKSDIYALGMVLYEIFTGKRAIRSRHHGRADPHAGERPDHQHVRPSRREI